MTIPESDYGTVLSTETTAVVDPYVGTLQYDAPIGDNQNKSILLGMIVQMMLLIVHVKI